VFCADALKFARLMNGTNTNDYADTYDAGDQQHVGKRRKTAKAERLRFDEALCWLMSDARGRRFMWNLLGRAGVFRISMAPNPLVTAFNEGRRDLGLGLIADMTRLCPGQYGVMQSEAQVVPDKVTTTDGSGETDGQ
jgi:hypothetical protein